MNRKKLKYTGTLVKYSFAIGITLFTYHTTMDMTYIMMSLLELAGIFLITNILLGVHSKAGNVIGFILHILFDAQMIVLNFGGIFTSWVMLTNLASIEDLKGKAFEYVGAVIIMTVFLIIPLKRVTLPEKREIPLFVLICFLEGILICHAGMKYTPLSATVDLYIQYCEQQRIHDTIAEIRKTVEIDAQDTVIHPFYEEKLQGGIEKPQMLPENPNIILIFTEALSSSILHDDRNIMPNMRQFEEESLHFSQYYNHTFATYRALIGQLYSGHQIENMEENHLISICDILEDRGYHTTFINVEPLNEDFSEYVSRFVQESINMSIEQATHYGTVPDRVAYQTLFDLAMQNNEANDPFFLSMYTLGTHASFDSPDIKFGNGENAMLNKFCYLDVSFGEFWEQYQQSPLLENTLLIVTADHACFADEDFSMAFPDYERESADCDEIPFMIYYNGVEPQNIAVNGRNSLDIAPTILDLLDIDCNHYFLGKSLFLDEETAEDVEYMFYDPTFKLSTRNGMIRNLNAEEERYFDDILTSYSAFKLR